MKRLTKAQQNKIRERYLSGLPVSKAELESLDLVGPPSYKRYPKGGGGYPRKHNSTKAQRRANASKRSIKRRVAKALQKFLKAQNPAAKFAGAKIRRNKGSITIIPIKLRRASR